MKRFPLIVLLAFLYAASCKNSEQDPMEISKIESERIPVDSEIKPDSQISEFIKPYREHLNKTLDSVIAYNPSLLSKKDGDLNTAIGNLMADVVMIQANPVVKKRTGRDIDFVLLNHGGIRAELPAGGVTSRSAYNLMPFENEIVVAELTGKKVKEMLSYLEKAKTAHPVSGIKIVADKNYKIQTATIKDQEIKDEKTYLVATSDYLSNGGDNMEFFSEPVSFTRTGYKIRNALIDYFQKTDTIKAEKDERYIRN